MTLAFLFCGIVLAVLLQGEGSRLDGGRKGVVPVQLLDSGAELMLRPIPGAKGMGAFLFMRTGYKDDPKGMEGLAHLVEHLSMTGGSPERKGGWRIEKWMRQRPMGSNAMTRENWTVYFSMGKRENILSDLRFFTRIAEAKVGFTQLDLARELPRISREISNMTLGSPGGFLMWKQRALLDPLERMGIGRLKDVRQIQLEDCEAFRDRHYRPERALFVLVGDLRPEEDMARLNRWLGKNKAEGERGAVPGPRTRGTGEKEAPGGSASKKVAKRPRPFVAKHKAVGAAFLSLAFRAPPPDSPQAPAFTMAAFYLVRKAQADFRPRGREAQAFFQPGQFPFLEGPSLCFLNRRAKDGESLEALRTEVRNWLRRRQKDRLQSPTLQFLMRGMSGLFWPSPIDTRKRRFLARNTRSLYTLGLSTGALYLNGFPPDFFARLQKLRPKEVQAALARFFDPSQALEAALIPETRRK
ncbi:MAG TPA: insulinase family protein [Planctomycetes bacterium]|nr:insulinase family protein [Planctomycetota bacterium]